jgi:hypothetical protein
VGRNRRGPTRVPGRERDAAFRPFTGFAQRLLVANVAELVCHAEVLPIVTPTWSGNEAAEAFLMLG